MVVRHVLASRPCRPGDTIEDATADYTDFVGRLRPSATVEALVVTLTAGEPRV